MTHVLWQAKMRLEKYDFTDLMYNRVTEYQGDFWSEEFGKFVTGQVISPIELKKENEKEINSDAKNHVNNNGEQHTTQVKP